MSSPNVSLSLFARVRGLIGPEHVPRSPCLRRAAWGRSPACPSAESTIEVWWYECVRLRVVGGHTQRMAWNAYLEMGSLLFSTWMGRRIAKVSKTRKTVRELWQNDHAADHGDMWISLPQKVAKCTLRQSLHPHQLFKK